MMPVQPFISSVTAVAFMSLFVSCLEQFDYFQSTELFANVLNL